MPQTQHRVFIIDDHPIYRFGLVTLLACHDDFTCCGEASDAEKAFTEIQMAAPEVVLLDLSVKGGNGLDTVKKIKEMCPGVAVLVLSMHEEQNYAPQALLAGASGYLPKDARPESVIEALRKIVSGGVAFSRETQDRMLHVTKFGAIRARSPLSRLSRRELVVFGMLGRGLATREIAEELKVSVKTIESHRAHIKEKLSLNNSRELVREAIVWADAGVATAAA